MPDHGASINALLGNGVTVPAGVRGPSTGGPAPSGVGTTGIGGTSAGGQSWALRLQNVLNPPSSSGGFLGIPGALGEFGARLGFAAIGLILFLGGLAVIGVSSLLPRIAGTTTRAATGAVKGALS